MTSSLMKHTMGPALASIWEWCAMASKWSATSCGPRCANGSVALSKRQYVFMSMAARYCCVFRTAWAMHWL
eukprot:CAMPEP_0174295022 /NCGR_PEP_ID=MMETSP0809-20121228/43399_1 /TAXON_ID=73025 ORGANISM="Eutreptiella gymnastica-like, Strain CCMP1594" /NCGR_SAMPLE_ID=MMETSP0809 /ASSEMBLY_ACC=CAM_ASM_000658 /LENGTH=70 /DNA_ID=CAMNT_0015396937 /DNA_START=94 /DNA_END=303 /DNA_ORIENTATION=+